ncbi:Bug family tripartite tricarboxylate transporter substrate binding protein [Muricoccus radiodurans]|uniref:Bug family tripartite tricarboxylate transporter substrate binding protein n=1 Tax=Muricoccus radiodurans TaxID=2231721 RepID=UPI003CF60DF4
MPTRRTALALLAGAPLAATARAQGSFPDQPVRMIIPFAPGGPADIIGRIVGRAMGDRLGQPVVIDSRSGAGGVVGVEAGARARPDGQTVVLASTGALVVLPHMMPRMPYDPQRDLAPIVHVLSVPQILVVRRQRNLTSLRGLVDEAKRSPGRLTFGSAGIGSSLHLAGELFKLRAGIDINHVPYRGAAPAITDLLAGNIDMILADVPIVLPGTRSGELVALGVTADARSPALPDVPTFTESGIPGVISETWYALFAPAGTPPDRITKLHDAVTGALSDPEVRRSLTDQGGMIAGGTSDALAALLRSEYAKWGEIVRVSGAKLE